MTSTSLEPGQRIGPYEVLGTLGKGGSGKVYHVRGKRGVEGALKLLDDPEEAAAVVRLRREVKALRALDHPAVPGVIDAEFSADDKYVVYEFVDGKTLTQHVAERGPLRDEELADLAETIASALEAVHAIGVIHRDVTPSNVMMSSHGPMLIDFGLAQLQGDDRLTRTGLVSGTLGFVAPEVIDGGEPDAAADFWSWAAVVAFAMLGRSPFGAGKGALRRTLEGAAELPALDGSDQLASALSPRRERRPSPADVIAALRGDESATTEYEMYAPGDRASQGVGRTQRLDIADGGRRPPEASPPLVLPPIEDSRAGTVFMIGLGLAAAAAVAPSLAVLAALALVVLCRAEHRRVRALAALEAKRPEKRGNAVLANAGLPWHLLRGLGEAVPSIALAALVGGGWAALWWWLFSNGHLELGGGTGGVVWGHALSLATGVALGLLLLWWGPWTGGTRDGGRRGALMIAPERAAARVWVLLCVVGVGAVCVAVWTQTQPWWWPLPPMPAAA